MIFNYKNRLYLELKKGSTSSKYRVIIHISPQIACKSRKTVLYCPLKMVRNMRFVFGKIKYALTINDKVKHYTVVINSRLIYINKNSRNSILVTE